MYGGLVCSSYLVIYGVSSIRFNHRSMLIDPQPRATVSWTGQLTWPDAPNDLSRAEMIRESLSIPGVTGGPSVDSARDLRFLVYGVMSTYEVTTRRSDRTVAVEERRAKPMALFEALHGLGRLPGMPAATVWWVFTEVSWIFMVFASATGVYLWGVRGEGTLGWKGVGVAALAFLAISYIALR
jgi:hypothetical protein